MITKAGGKERKLMISDFKNRLVQEVLRRILSCVYEPIFDEHSHGFRPGRSCHTALRDVRKNFKGSKWIIEGDISSFFDEVSHNKIVELLSRKIKDERFLSLIRKGLKSRILLPVAGSITTELGVPQGGVISPLLSNVMLHELDIFMRELHKEYNVGDQRPHSKEYRRMSRQNKSRKKARSVGLTPTNMMSDDYRRLAYVRYADDLIVGLATSRNEAFIIKSRIDEFLKTLELKLNHEKTLITDVSPSTHKKAENKACFLGYEIRMHPGV